MSGISRIQGQREEFRNQSTGQMYPPNKEIWLKDGDQAFLTSAASGEDGDLMLDELYLYTYRSGTRWVNLLSEDDTDTSQVPPDTRPTHKFAFWAYVHEVIHTDKRVDTWEEVSGPGGRKMYKEDVSDYKVMSLTFGRSDYIWNQLVDVYNDWGSLNKGVIRIKRTGTGMLDTSYTISTTARDADIPSDKFDGRSELPIIKEYFKTRYGTVVPSTNGTNGTSNSSEAVKLNELF